MLVLLISMLVDSPTTYETLFANIKALLETT